MATGTIPMMTWAWEANSGTTIYPDIATGTTIHSKHTVNYWIQQTIIAIRGAGYVKVYLRPVWEFNLGNISGTNNLVRPSNVALFRDAFRNFYVQCHAVTGISVRICWNPSVFGQSSGGLTLAQLFPNQVVEITTLM